MKNKGKQGKAKKNNEKQGKTKKNIPSTRIDTLASVHNILDMQPG